MSEQGGKTQLFPKITEHGLDELRKRSGLPVYDYVWFLKSQLAGYDPATA